MRAATREATGQLPAWTVCFLRERCGQLQQQLAGATGPVGTAPMMDVQEEDSIHCWTLLLVAAAGADPQVRTALEALHVLQARVIERLERGGVADISPDVDAMVRAILVDELQRQTDDVIDRVLTPRA